MKTTRQASSSLVSLLSVLAVLVVLAVLCVLGVLPAQGQLPRPQHQPYNTPQLKHYVTTAAFPWTLTVCKGTPYAGDYTDLSDALQAIPTRFPQRGPSQRVLVLLHPCSASSLAGPNYEETNLAVPSFTTLQGVPTGASGSIDTQSARVSPRLTGTNTTCEGCPSALLTLGNGTNLINLYVQSATPPTGPIRVVEVAGAVTLTNVVVQLTGTEVHPVDLLFVASNGGLLARDLGLTRNTFSSLSRGLVVAGSAAIHGGRFFVPSGVPVENIGTGVIKLYNVRIDPSSNVDLKRTSTGTIETFSTDYATETGGVIDRPIRADSLTLDNACRILTGTGSPEGIVAAPACSLYLRQDGTAATTLYVKTTGTGNTGWAAK